VYSACLEGGGEVFRIAIEGFLFVSVRGEEKEVGKRRGSLEFRLGLDSCERLYQ
jgi:hypothetical protein